MWVEGGGEKWWKENENELLIALLALRIDAIYEMDGGVNLSECQLTLFGALRRNDNLEFYVDFEIIHGTSFESLASAMINSNW